MIDGVVDQIGDESLDEIPIAFDGRRGNGGTNPKSEKGLLLTVGCEQLLATTAESCKKLLGRLSDFGSVELVGLEGTGSRGAD